MILLLGMWHFGTTVWALGLCNSYHWHVIEINLHTVGAIGKLTAYDCHWLNWNSFVLHQGGPLLHVFNFCFTKDKRLFSMCSACGLDQRLSNNARDIWMCILTWLVMASVDARHVLLQPCRVPCWHLPSWDHGEDAWEDELSCWQWPDFSIVSLVHWVGNANQPDAPPIRTILAGGNRPFGTHVQTIEDDSTEPAFQQCQ